MVAGLQVARLRRQETRQVGTLLARALFDDPFSLYLLPHERKRLPALAGLERTMARDAWPFGESHTVSWEGHLVGAALWLPPGAYPLGTVRQLRQLPGLLPAAARFPRSIGDALRAADAEHRRHPREPHWWLCVLGVDPQWQGRGGGRTLVEPTLARADETGMPCYLRTTKERNVAWYSRFGFTVLDELRAMRAGPPMWLMWREARPPGA